jgi:hypothetical protein
MRKAKTVNRKRKQVARESQNQAKRSDWKYQDVATTGLKAASQSIDQFNNGVREIADEMNSYSMRSLENVVHAWRQFLEARPLRQVVEIQTQYTKNAYEAYVSEISRLGNLYLSLTRQVTKPSKHIARRVSALRKSRSKAETAAGRISTN